MYDTRFYWSASIATNTALRLTLMVGLGLQSLPEVCFSLVVCVKAVCRPCDVKLPTEGMGLGTAWVVPDFLLPLRSRERRVQREASGRWLHASAFHRRGV